MDSPAKTAPSTAGMTTKVIKGSIWTLAGQVLPLAVSLITTPFTIRLLGAEGYGVLILIGLIPTYLAFADFGMGMASTKFASEAYAEGDEEKEGAIIRTSALISLLMSVPFAAGMAIFANQIIGLFNVPEHYFNEAVLALRIASLTFVINFLCNIFNTPQLTRLRMDLNSIINATSRILGLIATPIVIYLGYGILGASAVLLFAAVLNLFGQILASQRLSANLIGTSIELNAIRPLLGFGGGLVMAAISSLILLNSEKGILTILVSVSFLAFYSVAFTLASMLIMFSDAMIHSLIPAFTHLNAAQKSAELEELFLRAVKINLAVVLPASVVFSIISRDFFILWAGEEFGINSTIPFLVLMGGLIFFLPSYIPRSFLISAGRSDVIAKIYWVELLPYLLLVTILTYYFGIIGTALAWSIRVIVDGAAFFLVTGRVSEITVFANWKSIKWLLIGAIAFIPVILLHLWGFTALPVSLLMFSAAVLPFIYITATKVFTSDERSWIASRIRSFL